MIAAWMMLTLLVGTLLLLAALGGEAVARVTDRAGRWAWAAALAGCVALAALAPLRMPGQRSASGATTAAAATSSAGHVVAATHGLPVLGAASRMLARGIALAARAVPVGVARALGLGWLALSIGTVLAFLLVYARVLRLRRGWRSMQLEGVPVRVARDAGPALVGLTRTDVVVPRWLLGCGVEEQRLVLMHEREHMRAHDHWLLAGGCVAAALVPWHPAVWWMLKRLRLAVEVDCDRRVLATGADARAYGSLLIALAGSGPTFPPGSLALGDSPSHLERRLLAMTSPRSYSRATRVGTALLGVLALGAVVAACEARLPTSAEIQGLDARGAERVATRAGIPLSNSAEYFIDGERVARRQALALPAARIAQVDVLKGPDATGAYRVASEIRITTVPRDGAVMVQPGLTVRARGLTDTPEHTTTRGAVLTARADGFTGLLLVDGKRADPSVLQTLKPAEIESVEVIKGAAAVRLYGDPRAANGVIRVTLRK